MFEKKSELKAIKSECKHFCVFLQIGQYIRIAEKERNDQKKKKKLKKSKKIQCLLLHIIMRCREKPCFIKEMNLFNI